MKSRAEIGARLPAHVTGLRRQQIIERIYDAMRFEERFKKDPNISPDEIFVWLEESMMIWKELFGNEAANKYIDIVCEAFEKHLQLPPSAIQDLRMRLAALLAL